MTFIWKFAKPRWYFIENAASVLQWSRMRHSVRPDRNGHPAVQDGDTPARTKLHLDLGTALGERFAPSQVTTA